jgi:hypothetical protein
VREPIPVPQKRLPQKRLRLLPQKGTLPQKKLLLQKKLLQSKS